MWKIDTSERASVEPAIRQLLPPCQVRCPINEDIQRTNVLISLLPEDERSAKAGIIQIGDYLYDKNPFFNICGYICGLCELECNYKTLGGSIRRRLLKRFLSDHYTDYLKEKEPLPVTKDKEKVAIIGGGPGGLMCAYILSKKGYKPTIFESSDRLGGALWFIPDYRFLKVILKTTIDNLIRIASIDIKYNVKVGSDGLPIKKLKDDGYEAVFYAGGTPFPRLLTFEGGIVENQDLSGVLYGLNLLDDANKGKVSRDQFKNKRVIVIGGGNVAFDVARTARRLGGEVTVVALECEDKTSKDGIPADEDEIVGATEEGIKIIYSRGVREIRGENGKFKGINSPRCVSVFDEKGFNPKFDCSDCIDLTGDILLITIGQGADRAFLEKEGLLDERGRIAVNPVTLQSLKDDSVFIGGDARRIGFMVDAMKEGIEAAESIHRKLRGLDMMEGRKIEYEKAGTPIKHAYDPAVKVSWVPASKRMDFEMFEKGLTLKEAIEEARRCLACGPCISCKACVSIGLQESLPTVEVDEQICCGCGICVYVCNYDSARLINKEGKITSTTDMLNCKSCGMCIAACPSNARKLVGDATEQRISAVYASLT